MAASGIFILFHEAYGIIYLFVRGRQGYHGNARLDANTDRFRMAAEALGGAKEIQVLERRREFVARFAEPSRAFADHTMRNEVVGLVPRYAMETVAFGGILLIIVYLLSQGRELQQVLPTISLFAFGGYKLLPALQHLFESLTTVRFYESALDTLRDDLLGDGGASVLADVVPRNHLLRSAELFHRDTTQRAAEVVRPRAYCRDRQLGGCCHRSNYIRSARRAGWVSGDRGTHSQVAEGRLRASAS